MGVFVQLIDSVFRVMQLGQANLAGQGGAPAPALNVAAGEATQQAAAAAAPGGFDSSFLLMMGVMVLVFWMLIFRPQQKKQKQHQELLRGLKIGDNVITTGGIYGRITGLPKGTAEGSKGADKDSKGAGEGHVLTLEIAKDVRIRILKSQVAGRAASQSDGGSRKDKDLVEKG
jgi:preprotein translocase subunit YajC